MDRYVSSELTSSIKYGLRNLLDCVKKIFQELDIKNSMNTREGRASIALILIGGHLYYYYKYTFWSRRNIKGPRPLPGIGNALSFAINPKVELLDKWRDKYGRVFGYYAGSQPILVCADAALLKQISIKDFDKFPNRLFVGHKNSYQKHVLVALEDDHWRAVRAISSPTFSSGRMKVIYQLLKTCADDLIKRHERAIEAQGGQFAVINTKELFHQFSLNSAVKSFFGIQLITEDPKSPNSTETFAKLVKNAVTLKPYRALVEIFVPNFMLRWINFPLFSDSQMLPLANKAKKIVEHRRADPKSKANDYLQLLIDANMGDKVDRLNNDQLEDHHTMEMDTDSAISGLKRTNTNKYKLTDVEVYCNSMAFMFVATETTSTLMSHTVYLLSYHPSIQEKLYEELIKCRDDNGDFNYETIITCVYLDCVISESLRLMPPAINLDRVANEDYYIKDYDLSIPKGTPVVLAFSTILNDPEYWPEPKVFNPDRFAPENKSKIVSGAYCPFGIGPRACIGFRFALTEAKLGLARLLTRFKFEVAPGTKYPAQSAKFTFAVNDLLDLRVVAKAR